MDQQIIESIEKMAVIGSRMQLPVDMLTNYPQVKKVLVAAGGKYKKNGFDFPTDAQAIKDRLTGGEEINDKKKFQQFFTPAPLAWKLYQMCEAQPEHDFLEPSAGIGSLASVILEHGHNCSLIELDSVNVDALADKSWYSLHRDFLEVIPDEIGLFDRIIANPPFTNNQDIDHIKHMFKFLKPGGILVSLSSPSWTFGSRKKQVAFREWLENLSAYTEEVEAGTFKSSGTNVRTMIIKIVKPV